MCSTMIFDVIEYFAEYVLVEIIYDMNERCLISKKNCFSMVFRRKYAKILKLQPVPVYRPVTITGSISGLWGISETRNSKTRGEHFVVYLMGYPSVREIMFLQCTGFEIYN